MLWAYCRVSSYNQLDGLSMQMQGDVKLLKQLAKKFKTKVGKRVYSDRGRSAYKGTHLKGELGQFLLDIDNGYTSQTNEKISAGDILVIRHLDRLSRLEFTESMNLFHRIVKSGISIYTTMDSRTYSIDIPNELKAINNALVGFAFATANDESKRRSYFIKKFAVHRSEQFKRGELFRANGLEFPYDLGVGRLPYYMEVRGPHKNKYIKENVKTVLALKQAIQIFLKYKSISKSCDYLHSQNCGIANANFLRLLKSKVLLGDREIKINGNKSMLKGFLPELCSHKEFDDIQKILAANSRVKVKATRTTRLSGYRRFRCETCQAAVLCGLDDLNIYYQCRSLACRCGFKVSQICLDHLIGRTLVEKIVNGGHFKISELRKLEYKSDKLTEQMWELEIAQSKRRNKEVYAEKIEQLYNDLVCLKKDISYLKQVNEFIENVEEESYYDHHHPGDKLFGASENRNQFVRELVKRYISEIIVVEKRLIRVRFFDKSMRTFLLYHKPITPAWYAVEMTVVSEPQYNELISTNFLERYRYITNEQIRNRSYLSLTLDSVERDSAQIYLDVLGFYGKAVSRKKFIQLFVNEIEKSPNNLFVWRRGRGYQIPEGMTRNMLDRIKLNSVKLFSGIREFKVHFQNKQYRERYWTVLAFYEPDDETLLKTFSGRKIFELREVLAHPEKC